MKIKLPLTEKFLWDLYKIYNKTKNTIELIFPPNSSMDYILKSRFYGYVKEEWDQQNKEQKNKAYFSRMVQELKQNGYLKTLKIKDNKALMITSKGLNKLFKIQLKTIKKAKRKDSKWQMILFDIPENKRRQRNFLRTSLKYLGYQQLQKSIWVCQYDTLKETKELIKRYNIKPFVELLLVNKIGFK